MGNASSGNEVPFTLCNEIWKRLNHVICEPTQIENTRLRPDIKLFPNPTTDELNVTGFSTNNSVLEIRDALGKIVFRETSVFTDGILIRTGNWPTGLYLLRVTDGAGLRTVRFSKR